MIRAALAVAGLVVGAVLSRLVPQFVLGRFNWGPFGYFCNGLVGLALALLAVRLSTVAAGALAIGGMVAVLLRIGEDYGRVRVLRQTLLTAAPSYWRDVVEGFRYVGLAVFFLACLAAVYAGAFRLVWGEKW